MSRRNYLVFHKDSSYAILPIGEVELPVEAVELLGEFLGVDSFLIQGPSIAVEEVQNHIGQIMSYLLNLGEGTMAVDKFCAHGEGFDWAAVLNGVDIARGGIQ